VFRLLQHNSTTDCVCVSEAWIKLRLRASLTKCFLHDIHSSHMTSPRNGARLIHSSIISEIWIFTTKTVFLSLKQNIETKKILKLCFQSLDISVFCFTAILFVFNVIVVKYTRIKIFISYTVLLLK